MGDGDLGSTGPNDNNMATLMFSLADKAGALNQCLSAVKDLQVSLSRIESRPSQTAGDYDFVVDFAAESPEKVAKVAESLSKVANQVKVLGTGHSIYVSHGGSAEGAPWFPRKKSDLSTFAERVLSMGEELDSDHPGALDSVYRKRRTEITQIARTYNYGDPIPRVEYTAQEVATWGEVYRKLTKLFPTHACREFLEVWPLVAEHCGYSEASIPQLEDISTFLRGRTGFSLAPVMGLLSSRDFLNGLAFRVFHSTQYIRHHSKPLYTPEPDVCHETLGHVPLFADPDFADFSQEIGLVSLGASDEDIEKLVSIYWYTVEFGLCKEGSEVKAYGAGLLSSFGELEYSLTSEPGKKPFDPEVVANTRYPITTYQPFYFVAESFKDAQIKFKEWASKSVKRPFHVRYNPYTQSIEVLGKKEYLLQCLHSISAGVDGLTKALENMD